MACLTDSTQSPRGHPVSLFALQVADATATAPWLPHRHYSLAGVSIPAVVEKLVKSQGRIFDGSHSDTVAVQSVVFVWRWKHDYPQWVRS